ncbi:MAG: homogentisate 1,2-dioxygenase [Deltaproteobacteria bacterium]|nr:homogentisate 1,2-dioxygenase [Deltaproteobacteria bacterium]
MLDRMVAGTVATKHHIALRDGRGALLHEECFTRDGFDGPYTIFYHVDRPHTHVPLPDLGLKHGWTPKARSVGGPGQGLRKRHYRSQDLARSPGSQLDNRVALLSNDEVTLGVVFPDAPDPIYVANGDADELLYIHRGGGSVVSPCGTLEFREGDYVMIPRSMVHRFIPSSAPDQYWLWMELQDLHLLSQWRNAVGQLRMDAPYSHRDFRRPSFGGPVDEGIRALIVKRHEAWHGFELANSPLDVVGWDGTVYPWAFPILAFQPRVGLVHLPPTWHGTFGARGALVCSFVPRPVDFHPEAIPCPYPHSSPSCDEFIFYCDGHFTSRRGVGPGSISHHPSGIPHGPHPGAYERSIGTSQTTELAVMIDTFSPLWPTNAASTVEDDGYMASFRT